MVIHHRHRASIRLAGAISPPLFSKIVLQTNTKMAFSAEIFLHRTVVYKQGQKEAKSKVERGVFRPSKGCGLNIFSRAPPDRHCGSISPSTIAAWFRIYQTW